MLGIHSLFVQVQCRYLCLTHNSYIFVKHAIIHRAFVPMDRGICGYPDADNFFPMIIDVFEFQGRQGIEQSRIVGDVYHVALHLVGIRAANADDSSVVFDSQEDAATQAVTERTDRFEGILSRLVSAAFELYCG